MRNRFKYSLLILLLLSLHQLATAQQVTAKLDSTSILIGQQTTLRLFVHSAKNTPVSFPAIKDSLTDKIAVVRLDKTDTLFQQSVAATAGMAQTIRRNYIITAFDAGNRTIPAIKVKVGNDTLTTDPISLQVNSVKVDTSKAFYDIKQPIAVSYGFLDWLRDNWLWVLIGFWVLVMAVGLTIYLVKRPKPVVKVIEPPKPLVPPHVAAIKKLNELRDKKLWQMDFFKEYHSELTEIVREYIEARYSLPTLEKTTDEILSGLRQTSISDADRGRLQQLFVLADLVKFAKERPVAADNELSLTNAIAFIESTGKQAPREGGAADGVA